MPDTTNPLDIAGLVKILVDLCPVAITYIQKLKRWGKGKEIKRYVRDIDDRMQKIKLLVASLYAYRLLNLHTTEVLDDIRDIPEKTLHLEEQKLQRTNICKIIKKDLQRATNYFEQNLNNFRLEHLDHSHALMIRNLIGRIGGRFSTAEANLSNLNLDQFIDNDLPSLIKESCSLRGETFFAIDKITQEFGGM